jgi:hypothetical protein
VRLGSWYLARWVRGGAGTAATGSSRVGCFRFSVAEEEEMGDSSIRGGFRSHGRTATGFDN